jgi:hypothetical protein
MTGPEHYRMAEQALDAIASGGMDGAMAAQLVVRAQVNATVALAAATGLNDADGGLPSSDLRAWRAVAGTP